MKIRKTIDDAVDDSRWKGIATRIAFALAAMVLVHWLRDGFYWLSKNITHDSYIITEASQRQAVVGVTILGLISIVLEITYALILFAKERRAKLGKEG